MIRTLAAVLCLAAAVQADVTPYPRPVGDASNPQYSVTVNGQPVEATMTALNVGYAHFAFDGSVEVAVTASEPITKFDLSPHRLKIDAQASGNVLTFRIDRPCKLHLRINDLTRFFLFADPPEENAPKPGDKDVLSLAELGIASSTETLQTDKLQQAINQAAARKQTLYVPPGYYKSGRLSLPSNTSLYLAPGAMIRGTARPEDYKDTPRAQLVVTDASNVRVFGRGVIDNNGLAFRTFLGTKNGTSNSIVTTRASNVSVEDVIVRDPSVWSILMVQSDNLKMSNLKLISMCRSDQEDKLHGYNTDGFDPDNSSNVLIEDCFISVDDDPIAIKLTRGEKRDVSNIVFRGNVIWTMCSALKLGTEIIDGKTVSDVLFEDNDVVHADIGIAVFCYKGGYAKNVRWINNHFEQIGTQRNDSPHKHEAPIFITARSESSFGGIRDLLIENNTFEGFGPQESVIRAKDPNQTVENVVIDNLVIAGQKVKTAAEGRIEASSDVKNLQFK